MESSVMESNYRNLLDIPMDKATDILEERSKQYNQGGISPRQYWVFGTTSVIHEIFKKSLRLVSLAKAGNTAEMEDSIYDIINYCRFLYAEIKLEAAE